MYSIESGIDTANGAYLARVATEVEGSPEDVWRAVATGAGTEAWFVPAEIEERVGGRIITHHGEHGDSVGEVAVWEPPRRFEYVERDWLGPEEPVPDWVTVITVEPAAEGRCRVTLASGFPQGAQAHAADVDGTLAGWEQMFFNLRFYLANYRNEPAATLLVTKQTADSDAAAWDRLKGALQLDGGAPGSAVSSPEGAPAFAGTVLQTGPRMLAIHLASPVSGVLQLSANSFHDETWISIHAYLYGPEAAAAARREQPAWEEWLQRRQ
jgi:uncharacterized protein YndB with AHSA1/START domain